MFTTEISIKANTDLPRDTVTCIKISPKRSSEYPFFVGTLDGEIIQYVLDTSSKLIRKTGSRDMGVPVTTIDLATNPEALFAGLGNGKVLRMGVKNSEI